MAENNPTTQADGGEGPESPEEMKPTTRTCWDCGGEFTPKDEKQFECVRCYVARKM